MNINIKILTKVIFFLWLNNKKFSFFIRHSEDTKKLPINEKPNLGIGAEFNHKKITNNEKNNGKELLLIIFLSIFLKLKNKCSIK